MQLRKLLVISALGLALVPGTASAQDWFFTPFIGANFGGNATFEDFDDVDDEVEKRVDFGATIGFNPSVVGFEVDFGYSPNFFENTVGDADFEFGDSNVTTLMGNLLISAPPGRGIRPFGSAGLGLIRSSVRCWRLLRGCDEERPRREHRRRCERAVHRQRRHPRRHPVLPFAQRRLQRR
jgi:hypothetical protein